MTTNGQTQNMKKNAEKQAAEITEVLSLNKEETKSVYEIRLSALFKGQEIKKEFKDQPEIKKEKLKNHGNEVFREMRKFLGKERMKKWTEYKSKK
jgi:hypothetical protein